NGETELARVVAGETANMERLVSTYLDKARLAARAAVVGKRSDAGAVLQRLARVMGKLHPACDFAADIAEDVPWFRGEEGDLEEMVGNLADNACKWSGGKVRITAGAVPHEQNRMLRVCI